MTRGGRSASGGVDDWAFPRVTTQALCDWSAAEFVYVTAVSAGSTPRYDSPIKEVERWPIPIPSNN